MASTIYFAVIDIVVSYWLGFKSLLWRTVDYFVTAINAMFPKLVKRQRNVITGHGQRSMSHYKTNIISIAAFIAGHFQHKMAVNVNA